MWTIGHCCLGYLLSRPFFRKKSLRPLTILSIFFIATIQDFAHIYIYRTMTHSFTFFIPFTLLLVWIMYKLEVYRKIRMIPLFIAASTHIMGDILFGSYIPFFPFSSEQWRIFGWSSYLDYSVEILLFPAMMAVMYISGDLKNIHRDVLRKFDDIRLKSIFHNLALIGLLGAILSQIGALFYLDFLKGPNFYNEIVYNNGSLPILSLTFLITQILFAYFLVHWAHHRFYHLDEWLSKKIKRKPS